MKFLRVLAVTLLAALAAIENVSAFVVSPKTTTFLQNHKKVLCHSSHVATGAIMRLQRSLGALRMADGDAMDAAVKQAEKLKEQAAALRGEAASAEKSMDRDPASTAEREGAPAPPVTPDELEPTREISDNMKDRLKRELEAQGANPNKSAGNPILVVFAIVGLLVIVGGQGIFY